MRQHSSTESRPRCRGPSVSSAPHIGARMLVTAAHLGPQGKKHPPPSDYRRCLGATTCAACASPSPLLEELDHPISRPLTGLSSFRQPGPACLASPMVLRRRFTSLLFCGAVTLNCLGGSAGQWCKELSIASPIRSSKQLRSDPFKYRQVALLINITLVMSADAASGLQERTAAQTSSAIGAAGPSGPPSPSDKPTVILVIGKGSPTSAILSVQSRASCITAPRGMWHVRCCVDTACARLLTLHQ